MRGFFVALRFPTQLIDVNTFDTFSPQAAASETVERDVTSFVPDRHNTSWNSGSVENYSSMSSAH